MLVRCHAAFEPVTDGTKSRCFITSSYDASSHFEETTNEVRPRCRCLCPPLRRSPSSASLASQVLAMYKNITGEDLDMSGPAEIAGSE